MSRSMMIVTVGVGYFAVCAAIAVWAARRTRTSGDFFLAGRGVGVWTLAVAAMAATLSGFAFVGGPGLVYLRGIGAVYIVLPAAITSTLTAWVLARRLRLLGEIRGLVTIPEAVGARYRSGAAQQIAAVAILIATVCYTAANFLALGLIIDSIFATGVGTGVWIGAAVVVAYSATGGMLAGMYTDLFQGLLMALASVLVFVAVLVSGEGMATISRDILAADPGWFGPWGSGTPLAALSFFFVFGLGTLGQPHVLHKFYMLRDPRQLRWYPLLMTGALMLTLLLFVGVGMAIKARVATGDLPPLASADEATPTFLLQYTPVLLAALVFSGVAAAIMSTVNSFLNLAAAAITRDLTGARRSDAAQLRRGRWATVFVAFLGAVLAVQSGSLIALLGVVGWGLFAATLVPALAFGLAWKGATRAGAIASMLTGLLVTLVLEVMVWRDRATLPAGVSAAGIALLLAMLVFLGVSWLTRAQAARDLDADVAMIMER
jgi:SSS family transporter